MLAETSNDESAVRTWGTGWGAFWEEETEPGKCRYTYRQKNIILFITLYFMYFCVFSIIQ